MKASLLLSLSVLTNISAALPIERDAIIDSAFSAFKTKYAKSYATQLVEHQSLRNFEANYHAIREYEDANPQATFALNEYEDLFIEDMKGSFIYVIFVIKTPQGT
jgi:hypothetical protein